MVKYNYVVSDIKDFFYKLQDILEDYYLQSLDSDETMDKIHCLNEAAEKAGIEVNINHMILNNITPSSSYESSYC